MKKYLCVVLQTMLILNSIAVFSWAEEKKQIKLNPDTLIKAMEIRKRNPELFNDKEMLERYKRVAAALKKKE